MLLCLIWLVGVFPRWRFWTELLHYRRTMAAPLTPPSVLREFCPLYYLRNAIPPKVTHLFPARCLTSWPYFYGLDQIWAFPPHCCEVLHCRYGCVCSMVLWLSGLSPPGPAWIPICGGVPYSSGQQLRLPGSGQQYRDALPLLSPSCSHEQVQFRGSSSASCCVCFSFTLTSNGKWF